MKTQPLLELKLYDANLELELLCVKKITRRRVAFAADDLSNSLELRTSVPEFFIPRMVVTVPLQSLSSQTRGKTR